MRLFRKTAAILTAAAAAATLASCGTIQLTAVEPAAFEATAEKWGCEVWDVTESAAEGNDAVLVYETAGLADDGSGLAYALFSDDDAAGQYFEAAKEHIEEEKHGNAASSKGRSGDRYGRYSAATGGAYYAVSWIGNTCLYAEVSSGYEDMARDIMDELGY